MGDIHDSNTSFITCKGWVDPALLVMIVFCDILFSSTVASTFIISYLQFSKTLLFHYSSLSSTSWRKHSRILINWQPVFKISLLMIMMPLMRSVLLAIILSTVLVIRWTKSWHYLCRCSKKREPSQKKCEPPQKKCGVKDFRLRITAWISSERKHVKDSGLWISAWIFCT